MEEKYASIQGELRLLKQESDFIFPIEIWAYNDKLTRNGWRFENLEAHREKWAGIPVLCAYVNGGNTVGAGHNQETKRDKDGNPYQSFTASNAERIVGATSDEESDIRIEPDGENKWLVAKATLYRWYARELTDKIIADAEQGGVMSVSIEALVTAYHMEGDIEVEDDYIPLGITLLGDGVAPAVPGAHVAMLAEMESELKELKLRAASYIESAEKPQNNPINPTEKGVSKRMRLSKQQLRELQAKFSGYTVLAAEQNDNGIVVCLMSNAGQTAVYVMASLDDNVYPENIVALNAQVHFCAEGCDDVMVDACDMVETMSAECAAATSRAECAERELSTAKETIKQMEAAESARRLAAAEKKATDTLDAFNANREDKVDVKALEALTAEIKAGKFTACEDENHAWVGEKTVEEKVLSICAAAVMEMDKKSATARAAEKKNTYVWEKLASGEADDGSVEALLARKGIKA
jgi:hypothetical protein